MSLFLEPSSWPLVLCGPMLRKVTRDQVSVFVALREPALVTLSVSESNAGGVERKSTPAWTVALGTRLHVLVVTAEFPTTPLELGKLYRYSLDFVCDDARHSGDLARLGLLHGAGRVGLSEGALPSFALAADADSIQLYHCSCRLPHGDGVDALALLEAALLHSENDPSARPHQLVLGGDQIYADDVTPCLSAACSALGRELLGWSPGETLPFGRSEKAGDILLDVPPSLGDGRAAYKPWSSEFGRPPLPTFATRGEFVMSQTSFTSNPDDCVCHLLFLGEFAAMYLLAWSPELWPREQGEPTPPTVEAVFGPRPTEGYPTKLAGDAEKDWPKLERFVATLRRVRRVLANVPTAMIFDDHDVTDDWFLNRTWFESVMGRPAGRRVVRNALLAYAVFQDWGNQPEDYREPALGKTPAFGRRILNALTMPGTPKGPGVHTGPVAAMASEPPCVETEPDALDAVFDFPRSDGVRDYRHRSRATRKLWDFTWVTPTHQLLCLDTRTFRTFYGQRHARVAAELISLESLAEQLKPDRIEQHPLFIVSATPIFGARPVTDLKELGAAIWGSLESMACLDLEEWGNNEKAFSNVVETLAASQPAAILSGDVHYSFATAVECHVRRPGLPPTDVRLAQFCSSPLKNRSESPSLAADLANATDQHVLIFACIRERELRERLEAQLAWQVRALHIQSREMHGAAETVRLGLALHHASRLQLEVARSCKNPVPLRLTLREGSPYDAELIALISAELKDGALVFCRGCDVRSESVEFDPVTSMLGSPGFGPVEHSAPQFVFATNSIGQIQYRRPSNDGPTATTQLLWHGIENDEPNAPSQALRFERSEARVVLDR